MTMPFSLLDPISVADQFGRDHPFVALFEKTGYIPECLVDVFKLDGNVIEPSEYGKNVLPKEMLRAGEWLPDNDLLQKYYGISAEDVERLEYCL